MTPAQIRAALQNAQRDQKRAIDNYNREVRKHNAAVNKAVNDYNREVRNYNSKARAQSRGREPASPPPAGDRQAELPAVNNGLRDVPSLDQDVRGGLRKG
jgi:hypothetical protein